MSGIQKRLLFINPGDESIQLAHYAIVKNVELPPWAKPFRQRLSADHDTLFFRVKDREVPFAWSFQKREGCQKELLPPQETVHNTTNL